MTLEELEQLVEGCRAGNRQSQGRIYRQFYALGMSVCLRYARRREEAEEMCHDGFVRAFSGIGSLEKPAAIKGWLRQIFVRAAIDHYRKYRLAQPDFDPLEHAASLPATDEFAALDHLSWEEKLRLVQSLPPAYRLAFNLCAIEEYPTAEAAALLGIADGTLRGNLAKARFRLREMIGAEQKLATQNLTTR